MDDLKQLLEKILETIRRDVTNLHVKASGTSPLQPEHQDALVKYYKLLSDTKLAAKERELEEKIARAEEIISRGTAPKA
jgi:hypothetical protein